jgi:dCTP diphosphatase
VTDRLQILRERLQVFVAERDWNQFHSPKNLAMAMIVEAAELVEHFQWLTEAQSAELPSEKCAQVEQEIADTFIYLLRLSDVLGFDLIDAAHRKMDINAQKYPAEKARGRNDKYTSYQDNND